MSDSSPSSERPAKRARPDCSEIGVQSPRPAKGGRHKTPAQCTGSPGGLNSSVSALNPNPHICAMLTDFYQITMGYAYFKAGKMDDHAVFDLYFRKNPFGGEYTVFAGLDEVISLLREFHFTDADVEFLQEKLPPDTDPAFFEYLKKIDASQVRIFAVDEGSIVFPAVPLIRIEGPLMIIQLLETPLLNLINYASLVTTNAARFRVAVGDDTSLLEFGLRRAQGPNGALSASKYCYMGGFNATSNVLAGQLYHVPVAGTHAHAFVSSFAQGEERILALAANDKKGDIPAKLQNCEDFIALVKAHLKELVKNASSFTDSGVDPNKGETLAFATYAYAFPSTFLALVDTYNVMKSGIVNFCAVAMALADLGYKAAGIRLDSGDLAYLSVECRRYLQHVAESTSLPHIGKVTIVASNDINEETLYSLANQGHEINAFGIGTHLVTCQAQPALGCVFKLVMLDSLPRMKLSQDVTKITIPGRKEAFRLYSHDGSPIVDILQIDSEKAPEAGQRVLCRHPFFESKRVYVTPAKVEKLLNLYWDGAPTILSKKLPTLDEKRAHLKTQIGMLRSDHLRSLNPTPYKVSVTDQLYKHIHQLWLANTAVAELC